MSQKETGPSQITIGDTLYKSGGNIIFPEDDNGYFVNAESAMLEKVDKSIQESILENGMQMLLKKLRV